ncbi:MAG: UDP-N-acetylmuramoyl-tripeptide--D-alanyl-D-alanine ligase [Actinomycetales bacterium]|nr:UDP-N-acetylmuramoyl-tripeptide--D-alanyl-D-alanine ligase [Actinomycetales bacterium]
MIELSLAQVAELVGGRVLSGAETIITAGVETDSRLVEAGSLFVAKPGEVTDGHNFVSTAKDAGAVAAIVERELTDVDLPQVLVDDSVKALGLLAKGVLARVRDETGLKVIGITGSNGKTTTKNMLRAILSQVGPTVAPIESYNNEVGAPISVLKIDRETKYLVAELGAGGPGSIAYLTEIVRPDVAVELKVGLAHAGEFGGIETTAKIKAELLVGSDAATVAVLNLDDVNVREMAADFAGAKLWFGTNADADYWADNYSLSLAGTAFDLHWPDGSVNRVTLQILGEHHVMNALASAAVADSLGVDRGLIIGALQALPLAERWRMQVLERPDGITIINDAYNASPDSSRAALQTLAQLGRLTGRRTVAVIGEMAELGQYSKEEHDKLGRLAVRLNIDLLAAVGPGAKLVYMGASFEGSFDGESQYFESVSEALTGLRGILRGGDIVLVKSSKSANLRHLGDDLAEVGK